jgi:Tol biopolymer transport system component
LLQALGYAEIAGGERQAYITEGDQLYTVREGDSFAGKYKLLKLTPSLVEIENKDSHTTTQLPFSHRAAEVLKPDTPTLETIATRLENLERRFESLEKRVGTFLASNTPLTTLPLPTNAPRRLDELLREFGFSSQAAQSLILNEEADIYLTKLDGSASRKITRIRGMPAWPRWSADGRVMGLMLPEPALDSAIFQDFSTSADSLHSLLVDGEKTPTEANYLLSLSERLGLTRDWVIHDTAGVVQKGGVHPLKLSGGQTSTVGLVPTKDGGRSVVLVMLPYGELSRYDTKSHAALPYLKGVSAEGMDFSRDGEWLTYVSYPEGTLWREQVDGKERLQLTPPSLRASSPRWSPDGKQVVFSATTSGTPWSLFIVPIDGGSPQQLTTGEHNESDANWSPDGNALMFSTMYGLGGAGTAIYVLDLKSKQISQLPGSEGMYGPRWSLDGRFVAASTVGSRTLELYDFESKNWSEVASIPATWKVWSRDGSCIYFDVNSSRDPAIYRLRISDHKLERVANLKGFRRLPAFGPWFTLAPDDSPIIARETDSQEIYALDW